MTNPYIDKDYTVLPIENGRLDSLTFAVKDLFELEGHQTSLGNPFFKAQNELGKKTSPIIINLLKEGALLKGITVTDEFMWSIKGSNIHYKEPLNPNAPDRLTGGSSSGSSSAVASKLVDFALGTDTGGSIRVPASYTGIFGIRPTFRNLDNKGVYPLAQSFDTVGFFANDIETMVKVGEVFFDEKTNLPDKYLMITDAFDTLEPKLRDQAISYYKKVFKEDAEMLSLPERFSLEKLLDAYRIIQGIEAFQNYGQWYEDNKGAGKVGEDIASRFEWAKTLQKDAKYQEALLLKETFTDYMEELSQNYVIVIPSATSYAPLKTSTADQVETIRQDTMAVTSIAGLAGLPQLSLPISNSTLPLGLSIIGKKNSDLALINLAKNKLIESERD